MTTLGEPLVPDAGELARLLASVALSGRWTNGGPLSQRLRDETRTLLGWPHAVLTSSGTSALTVALLALDLPAGGEVVTTPLTFVATAQAIESAGLVPVFAAVDPSTLTLSPEAVAQAIGPRTVAIVPVHLFGIAVDAAVDTVAADHGLPVVYDAAHAFGFDDIVGRGSLTAYSLHATKILHTGEGGLVATADAGLADRATTACNFGLGADGVAPRRGTNAKLPETSAAVGLAMVNAVPDELDARRRLRERYVEAVDGSTRGRRHAPGVPRGLVMEVFRCDPGDRAGIERELSERDVIARSFPALCAPGSRYARTEVIGATPSEMTALADGVLAVPFHGRVPRDAVDALAAVLTR